MLKKSIEICVNSSLSLCHILFYLFMGFCLFVTILIISNNLMFPLKSVHWQVDIRTETYVTFYHVCFKDSYDFAVRNLSNKHR